MSEAIFVKSWEKANPDSRPNFDMYHSVEMKPAKALPIYQFKLYQTSGSNRACILIKENSEILDYLTSGIEMPMNYYPNERHNRIECFKTKIRNIRTEEDAPYEGCVKVDLSILDSE